MEESNQPLRRSQRKRKSHATASAPRLERVFDVFQKDVSGVVNGLSDSIIVMVRENLTEEFSDSYESYHTSFSEQLEIVNGKLNSLFCKFLENVKNQLEDVDVLKGAKKFKKNSNKSPKKANAVEVNENALDINPSTLEIKKEITEDEQKATESDASFEPDFENSDHESDEDEESCNNDAKIGENIEAVIDLPENLEAVINNPDAEPDSINMSASEFSKLFSNALLRSTKSWKELADEENLKCLECDKTFTKKRFLQKHINGKHLKLRRKNTRLCDICGKPFTNQKMVQLHKEREHKIKCRTAQPPKPMKALTCSKCNKTFKQPKRLRDHVMSVHADLTMEERNALAPVSSSACETCGEWFATIENLNRHLNS